MKFVMPKSFMIGAQKYTTRPVENLAVERRIRSFLLDRELIVDYYPGLSPIQLFEQYIYQTLRITHKSYELNSDEEHNIMAPALSQALMCLIDEQGYIRFKDIPDIIYIGGHTYKIEFIDNLTVDRNVWGECWVEGTIIQLEKAVPFNKTQGTFVHEALEAVNGVYSLSMDHGDLTLLAEMVTQALITCEYS